MEIIGCGGIANVRHLPALQKLDAVELVAACDIKVEKAKTAAQEFGIPAYYEDYNEVLNIEGLDAVDICTPNYLHSQIAVKALEKGINVFCEKPDAVSVAETEKMKAAAKASSKVLMVMRNNRYMPCSRFVK